MTDRAPDGKFVKGSPGISPGRPTKEREVRYQEIMLSTCSFDDWEKIIKKAVKLALDGDSDARKWLSENLIGKPLQRTEMSGRDGESLVINIVRGDAKAD
jgi:hypothetical protein